MAFERFSKSQLDLDVDSSPDPLSASLSLKNRPTAAKSGSKPVARPFAPTSGNVQRAVTTPSKSRGSLSSPKKTITLHTPKSGGQSPWKIKVTVEAEPEYNAAQTRDVSPTPKPRSRTTTMTVPLKDPGDSPPVRRRGRPRKSISSESPKKKRASTPARGKSASKDKGEPKENENADLSLVGSSKEPKRKRGRPRKSSIHSLPVDDISGAAVDEDATSSNVLQKAASKSTDEDDVFDCIDVHTPQKEQLQPNAEHSQQVGAFTDGHNASEFVLPSSNVVASGQRKDAIQFEDVEEIEEKPFCSDQYGTINSTQKHDNTTNEEEGNVEIEDDSVLESEGFSIVSIDSLPSMRVTMSSPVSAPENQNLDVPDKSTLSAKTSMNVSAGRNKNITEKSVPSGVRVHDYAYPVVESIETERTDKPSHLSAHGTPSVSRQSPSNPPALISTNIEPRKASTPKLARVVKAGIALQGLLDTKSARTPGKSPIQAAEDTRSRMDEIFSGFGEGTRRELKAGLRFGEELARRSQERNIADDENPTLDVNVSSRKKVASRGDDVFGTSSTGRKIDPRLPTPDENDNYSLTIPPPPTEHTNVQYPSLTTRLRQVNIASPARSEDAMSWQPDTPPSTRSNSGSEAQVEDLVGEQAESSIKYPSIAMEKSSTGVSNSIVEDMSDIWEEEASREDDRPNNRRRNQQETRTLEKMEDPPVEDSSLLRPRRSKLPKTWRRVSSSDFNYSDELEQPEPELAMLDAVVAETTPELPPTTAEDSEVAENDSQDDTGMFWKPSVPAVFQRRDRKTLSDRKLDLSELLGLNNSPLKSSPLSSPNKLRPFKDATPFTSPIKLRPAPSGSPLKRQVTPEFSSDDEFSEMLQEQEVAQDSLSSDCRQILNEMEAAPIFDGMDQEEGEATETADNAEELVRTPIRSANTTSVSLTPSRAYTPLFSGRRLPKMSNLKEAVVSPSAAVGAKPTSTDQSENKSPTTSSIFTRLTRTLFSTTSEPAPPANGHPDTSSLHPLARSLGPLPRAEPWTKTHYVALDSIYQQYKHSPSTFSASLPPNASALASALPSDRARARYLGARFTVWGYGITITADLLVMAAVFAQALTARDIAHAESATGRAVERGNVCPRFPTGVDAEGRPVEIDFEEVVRRLVTVVLGEAVRRDEARGKGERVKRERGMRVVWAGERSRRKGKGRVVDEGVD